MKQSAQSDTPGGHRPLCIGITGGIGSGKSVVSRILRLKGYKVYDCDTEARRLMEEEEPLVAVLTTLLGKEAYDCSGKLCRAYVGSRIFCDDALRAEVNRAVHAAVRNHFARWSSAVGSDLCFCESAILASSGMAGLCNRVWVVDAPEKVRIERVMKRNGLKAQEVADRIATQRAEAGLLDPDRCDVIENAGSHSLLMQIEKYLSPIDSRLAYQPKNIQIC